MASGNPILTKDLPKIAAADLKSSDGFVGSTAGRGTGLITLEEGLKYLDWKRGYHSNPNLLINPDFAIWQRYPEGVYEGVPNNKYIVDGYKFQTNASSLNSVLKRVATGGIYNESGGDILIRHYIENAEQFNGTIMTFSLLKNNGLVSITKTVSNWTRATEICNFFFSQLWLNSGETIYRMKLELGSVQTLAHKEGETWVLNDPPPDYGQELAKCQRYLRSVATGKFYYIGWVNSVCSSIYIPFDSSGMRATPKAIVQDFTGNIGVDADNRHTTLVYLTDFTINVDLSRIAFALTDTGKEKMANFKSNAVGLAAEPVKILLSAEL